MRKYLTQFIILIIVAELLVSCGNTLPAAKLHAEDDPGYIPCVAKQMGIEVSSEQAFVYDVGSGKFIFKKGEASVIYPASTTKLLTILYALELLDPGEIITPGDELMLLTGDASIAYIKTYHKISVEMLIEGMLLPSGNDAALSLAAAAGKKLPGGAGISGKEAVKLFVEGMNSYAEEIGLCGSHFTSPDGYYTEEHYTTIEDIALIALMASQNEMIMKYAGMYSDDVIYESGHINHWINTNLLLNPDSEFYDKHVTGLKTGSAGTGNYSLICTVGFGTREYIIGLFASPGKEDRYRDAQNIIEYLENSWR